MNPQGTCKETCGYYSYSKVYGCYQSLFCSTQRRCNGKLINCQYVDSDMWVCPSVSYEIQTFPIDNENNHAIFHLKKRRRAAVAVTSTSSTRAAGLWGRRERASGRLTKSTAGGAGYSGTAATACATATTTTPARIVTSISGTSPPTSTITSGSHGLHLSPHHLHSTYIKALYPLSFRVVTGVRMQKANRIIHIQIQEGVLKPRGRIEGSSVSWKPIDNYTIIDSNVRAGVDYHTIMWEKRAVDLDDLDSPADHLLTGLRFRLVGAHLNLEIRMTPFNFTTGMLMHERSVWHSHDTTEASEIYDLNGETRQGKKRSLHSNTSISLRGNVYIHICMLTRVLFFAGLN